MITIKVDIVSLDSTNIKVHPDGIGTLKNSANNRSGNLADVTPETACKQRNRERVTGFGSVNPLTGQLVVNFEKEVIS